MQEWFKVSIDGKHVILTGGSGGVGRFVTAALAAKGARISVFDIEDLPQEYENTRLFKCDLADGEAIAQAVKDATDADRKSGVEGRSVAGRGDIGGSRNNKK